MTCFAVVWKTYKLLARNFNFLCLSITKQVIIPIKFQDIVNNILPVKWLSNDRETFAKVTSVFEWCSRCGRLCMIIEIIKKNQTMNKRVAVTTKDKLKLITKECLSNRNNCFHGYFRVVSVCNKNKESVFYKRNQYCRSRKGGCDVFFGFPQKRTQEEWKNESCGSFNRISFSFSECISKWRSSRINFWNLW